MEEKKGRKDTDHAATTHGMIQIFFLRLCTKVKSFIGASQPERCLRALIEGAKKYPPPVGITQSADRLMESLLTLPSVLCTGRTKVRTRLTPILFCPIMGSM